MKIFKYISILALITIVSFVNYYKPSALWNLVYYFHYYLIAGVFIYLGWKLCKDILTRSLLISLGFYYCFEFSIDLLDIFNHDLKLLIYKGKYINYILGFSMGLSLIILPIIKKCTK